MGKKRKLDSKSPSAAAAAAAAAASAAASPAAIIAAASNKVKLETLDEAETLVQDQARSQTLNQQDGNGGTLADQDGHGGNVAEGEGRELEMKQDQEREEDEEEEEEESDPASIQALLDSFPKDQLVELLRDAAVAHGDVLASVRRAADADPAQRKIFVHGLGWDATADTLSASFGSYGDIEDLKVVADRATGKCKGYGFILFRHRAGARRALREPQKKIGNRTAACQLASVGPVPPGSSAANALPAAQHVAPPAALSAAPVSEYTQRKIFVSNVGAEVDPQKLLQFFARFGEIEEGPLGLDKASGKPKGFALFVYKSVESAKKALEEPHKNFEGIVLHCQKAIDGPKPSKGGGAGYFHGAGGSGGRKGGSAYGAVAHHLPSGPGAGHLMVPSASGLGPQPGAISGGPGLNPALGQALTALLATQGTGLGLNNILGTMGANGVGAPNAGVGGAIGGSGGPGIPGAYGNSGMIGGYGGPGQMQGGYGGAQQGGLGRNYMGH